MKKKINEMKLRLPAISTNESVARSVISAFCAELNPAEEEIGDLKCAVSEAFTNCIVHAYKGAQAASHSFIYISVRLYDTREVTIEISDNGCGIADISKAKEVGFTTGRANERCGMGFLVMESFTDSISIKSKPGKGTSVLMQKILR